MIGKMIGKFMLQIGAMGVSQLATIFFATAAGGTFIEMKDTVKTKYADSKTGKDVEADEDEDEEIETEKEAKV